MSDLSVSARNLAMRYGSGVTAVDALRGVSLDVAAGEILMIRGPSGSGKTTLLQLIGALKPPTGGELSLFGTRIDGLGPDALRRVRLGCIGFVFQTYNLFPALKAWENVAVALDLHGWTRSAAEARARALLGRLGLADRAEFHPAKLSGGQRQRIAIARALAHDPALVLCDEPTAALDWSAGRIVVETLRRLAHDEKRAVVIVSHDSRIERFVDRICTVEDGVMVEQAEAA